MTQADTADSSDNSAAVSTATSFRLPSAGTNDELRNVRGLASGAIAGWDKLEETLSKISFAVPPEQPDTKVAGRFQNAGLFKKLGAWQGVVSKIEGDCFWATLTDLAGVRPLQEAEFFVEDVPSSDRGLVQEGAVFYWNIGFIDTATGMRDRVSQLRFRRLPAWRETELKRAKVDAERLSRLFD